MSNPRFRSNFLGESSSARNFLVDVAGSHRGAVPNFIFGVKGFDQLIHHLPYCRPGWDVYDALFDLLLGKCVENQPHTEASFTYAYLLKKNGFKGTVIKEKEPGKIVNKQALRILVAMIYESSKRLYTSSVSKENSVWLASDLIGGSSVVAQFFGYLFNWDPVCCMSTEKTQR